MLDLEGVLIATALPKPNQDYGVRPNAQQFVDEVFPLFDQVYMNTCVREEKALKIMEEIFGVSQLQYYNWEKSSPFGKASGYEQFSETKLIHVEDESPKNKEAQRIMELGHTYISVPTWTISHAYVDKNISDVALLTAINTIKEKLILPLSSCC